MRKRSRNNGKFNSDQFAKVFQIKIEAPPVTAQNSCCNKAITEIYVILYA
jgi:hypothetical protein